MSRTRTTREPRILLYGKDARTDAIAEALRCSEETCQLTICSPLRVPGLVEKADRLIAAPLTDLAAMLAVADDVGPDLVIVGPEDPLAVGLVDALSAGGTPCFGPEAALARIETSKSWARALVTKHQVPGNLAHRTFRSPAGLAEFIAFHEDVVVKPDGLTGGKGVKVMGEHLSSPAEALAYAESLIAVDGSVVLEERLQGEEFSLQTITDGTTVVHCPVVQDHKRAYPGDSGPNTGGMGSYSCPDHSLPFLSPDDVANAQAINERVVAALAAETGRAYRGVLYGGFMAVADGVRLIEYNARFGDPEATNVLPLMRADFLDLCRAVAGGRLAGVAVEFERKATVCKYVVPSAYPGTADGDSTVEVEGPAGASPGLRRYWGAARLHEDGHVSLTGSRGIAFVGIASTLVEAEGLSELGTASVRGRVRHRSDIGSAALVEGRVAHLRALRRLRPPAGQLPDRLAGPRATRG